jgi:hypothetical protein
MVRDVVTEAKQHYANRRLGKPGPRNYSATNKSPVVILSLDKNCNTFDRWSTIAVLHPFMIWRSVTLFKCALQNPNKLLRVVLSVLVVVLANFNIAGLITNIFQPVKYKDLLELGIGLNGMQESIALSTMQSWLHGIFFI